ncbi:MULTISPECIES: phosphohistidine phosphatase SixA [Desulfococcus]|uniref:Phosphohistidine phosphatase, SixA n=1 Tax=Desulfococcus multivorans DSM 2059 TaxID=1121405 RepID=S7U6H7_DESML|nr:phosphohistidine phosphatase SixA [Desulfococcus multivorans]AOY59138.1 SixA: phosphohistidine phosphatase [Desulfococcus multivorans]AQV03020.1 phosphohistidine phosphatase SixA [Desulfococcus multivorans]EPR44947.1 phosphohistidine phosphatase, SixA [Desulfococcus multivorans DSM 2059]MDX9818573.1 phosphohistidine phosphatase SixA [Desulfococcus multivorans]SJZ84078.1 phosphohistidine phosphatase, SixA [Desulfococcus multivorans DSM 2059]
MPLYLVQHGKSLPRTIDPEQPLSPEGEADVRRIAGVAQGYGVTVSRILHSGKRRALETAEIIAEYLNPRKGVSPAPGLGPLDEPEGWMAQADPADSVMLVGHLPFMEKLAAGLVTGNTARPIFRFQNGGIVCLDTHPDTPGDWVIKWALMPQVG